MKINEIPNVSWVTNFLEKKFEKRSAKCLIKCRMVQNIDSARVITRKQFFLNR